MSGIKDIPLIQRAKRNKDRRAIIASEGVFNYQDVLNASAKIASSLVEGVVDLKETCVGFLIPPGFHYVAVQWGIWRAGGIAVPLSIFHPRPELEYVIQDSDAAILVAQPDFEEKLRPIAEKQGRRLLLTTALLDAEPRSLPEIDVNGRAMILYTSGTSGKSKGVVTTHRNIEVQVKSLVSAWEWTQNDHVLNVLPLNHIHGIINVLTCALWAGATCEILPKFDAEVVWSRILEGNLTLFMAVPTIYVKLIAAWKRASSERQKAMSDACSKLRLMVSGSAALPVNVIEEWKTISGHVLLERYGMTEIGMALSNPLHEKRVPGYVGNPLPDIEVRLVDEQGKTAMPGTPGEIQVRGPGVFLEYWRKPDVTKNAFCEHWFSTGDIAVVENGIYHILGRSSVDIIKTGGYKVSALEIEEVLLTHPDIQECAVVGVEDPEWGERVSAALVLKERRNLSLVSLRDWVKERLATYKIPTQILLLEGLPRNVMGKVFKPDIAKLFREKKGTEYP
ncbi:MAG: acyl-CoA synthetase [Candidatus Aminicenantes bacterium]|nr:MAG: acyl-CoA synthetase [Candidatus Aminicenantes bacterium]